MATILNPDGQHVLMTCSCHALSPLTRLYFCRHCIKLRCQLCVSHEVDSYYCPNCLENMPSAEAKLKRNRCANCFDCPSCGNTLSTRATAVAVQSDDAKTTQAKKVYYLACAFCRWSSRDVGIPDRSVASGGWQEQDNPVTKRIGTLVDYYRQLAHNEKIEQERKKLSKRRSYMHFADRIGLSTLTRRKSSLSYLTTGLSAKGQEMTEEEAELKEPSVATEDVDTLPEEYYTKPLVLERVPRISQRLANPEFQPGDISSLYPRHKHLLAKRSQRCRECEHNLSKPEFNPSSIKFKIQLGALHYVPRLRIAGVGSLECDKEGQVTLTLTNPVENIVKVSLLPYIENTAEKQSKDSSEEDSAKDKNDSVTNGDVNKEDDKDKENQDVSKENVNDKADDGKEDGMGTIAELDKKGEKEDGMKMQENKLRLFKKAERQVDNRCDSKAFCPTAEVVLPTFPLALAARDEAAEYDEADVNAEMFSDDPRVVADRQSNKLWFYVKLTPKQPTGDVKFSMVMQYDYKHTLTALVKGGQEPEERIDTLRHIIHINLGPIEGATAV
ncbi:dynactin subunit 4 isoform X2 [Nematostella vectensis]|uniref:dynactin subunit 4 isoform X2 n=1 Tax=Nematostella vectensis TaxID=45351 RepID=UPI0020776C3D|nr:dynactin subunit 4 isoform X2 [Nematostella vectensis]